MEKRHALDDEQLMDIKVLVTMDRTFTAFLMP